MVKTVDWILNVMFVTSNFLSKQRIQIQMLEYLAMIFRVQYNYTIHLSIALIGYHSADRTP